jgi:sugar lactone lactonase YvrE
MDPAGNLVIADTRNSVIRRITLGTGIIETIAGNGQAGFAGDGGPAGTASMRFPEDVGHAPDGTLHVADSGNHCVRRVDSAGNISTVAGVGGVPGFDGDGGAATVAHLDTPAGIGFDAQGNLWIADTFNHRIRRVRK